LLLFKQWQSFGFLHHAVIKYSDILAQYVISIFRVTELFGLPLSLEEGSTICRKWLRCMWTQETLGLAVEAMQKQSFALCTCFWSIRK